MGIKESLKHGIQNVMLTGRKREYNRDLHNALHSYDSYIERTEKGIEENIEVRGDYEVSIVKESEFAGFIKGFDTLEKSVGIVCVVAKDCTLSSFAASVVAQHFEKNPECEIVYSDEDFYLATKEESKEWKSGRIPADRRVNPVMKPVPSIDTFLSYQYFGRFFAFKTSLLTRLGKRVFEDENDLTTYDFLLRAFDSRIEHIPLVLAHNLITVSDEERRELSKGTQSETIAANYREISEIIGNGEEYFTIKKRFLKANNLAGTLEMKAGFGRVVWNIEGNPKVSILIPSKDHPEILKQCIDSVVKLTDYRNFEFVVIDNGSSDENKSEYCKYLDEIRAGGIEVKYIYYPSEFNYSAMNNEAARNASGEYLVLLNDDIEVTEGEWLGVMLGQCMQEGVGAVGVKLLYPGGEVIQHVGITNAVDGPVHKFIGKRDSEVYHGGRNRLVYNTLGVTGACLMISKADYEGVGGLDEELRVAYNDVDLCFKLIEKGLRNVVRCDVSLIHHESLTRGADAASEAKLERLAKERSLLYTRHPGLYRNDPYEGAANSGGAELGFDTENIVEERSASNPGPSPAKKDYRSLPGGIAVHFDRLEKDPVLQINGKDVYCLQGYALIPLIDNMRFTYEMVLMGDAGDYVMPMKGRLRMSLSGGFPDTPNIKLAGFCNFVYDGEIPHGTYEIGVYAKDHASRRRLFQPTGRKLEV